MEKLYIVTKIILSVFYNFVGFSVREPIGFSTLPPKGAEEPLICSRLVGENLGIEKPRSSRRKMNGKSVLRIKIT